MSSFWSWFVIIGTLGSLAAVMALLFGNRQSNAGETTGHAYDGIEEYDNPLPMWWVGMFVLSVVFAIGYLIWYPGLGSYTGLSGWSSEGQWQRQVDAHEVRFAPLYAELAQLDEAGLHASRQAQQVGRRLFINHCSTCHGVTGQGAFGFPNLTDDDWIWGAGFDRVEHAIRHGLQAAMPGWGGALGETGITQVSHFVLQLAGREHDAGAAAAGAEQYRIFCVACHGETGEGNPLLGSPNLTNDIWLYGGSLAQIAHTLRFGRSGNMPGHADILSEEMIHILAGYVTSLSKP
jgi:cytochrome c oxidase cbb3-type subunit 3